MKASKLLMVGALALAPCLALAQETPAPQAYPRTAPPSRGVGQGFGQGQGPAAAAPRAMEHHPDLGAWWKNSEIVRALEITPQQVSQIEQNFLDHRLKLIDLRADVERQETRLQPLIEADQIDEAKISAQIDLVLAARARLEKANVMMMLSIRKVLSVDQWKKLEEMKHRREGMERMRRMGPPRPDEMPPEPPRKRPPDEPGIQ